MDEIIKPEVTPTPYRQNSLKLTVIGWNVRSLRRNLSNRIALMEILNKSDANLALCVESNLLPQSPSVKFTHSGWKCLRHDVNSSSNVNSSSSCASGVLLAYDESREIEAFNHLAASHSSPNFMLSRLKLPLKTDSEDTFNLVPNNS